MQNITTQFLGSLSATQYKSIVNTVRRTLPPNQQTFTQDWVHETITSWCLNDSFGNYLSTGKNITVSHIINLIKGRNIVIRDKWGKDALNRSFGLRTKDERQKFDEETQVIRTSAAYPSKIVVNEDEETEVSEVHISDNSFEKRADIHRTIKEIYDYCAPIINDPLFEQYFGLYMEDHNRVEIAEIMGVEFKVVVSLKKRFEKVAREGRAKGLIDFC